MIIVDAHEDIAWNMLTFQRDYTRSVAETRRLEAGGETPSRNGDTLLGWPEWVRGRVGLILATLFAAPARRCKHSWDVLCYEDSLAAHRLYRAQLDVYRRLEELHPDKFRLVVDGKMLEEVLEAWLEYPVAEGDERSQGAGTKEAGSEGRRESSEKSKSERGEAAAVEADLEGAPPIGLIPLMEGADGVREPDELEAWYEAGVRILGPAWAGTRYAGGTWEPGGFTPEGHALLEVMAELGMALDLSHLSDEGAQQALDRYPGPVLASHSNARALLAGNPEPQRHLTDPIIRAIAEREGVIGIVIYNFFLRGDWRPSDGRAAVSLDHVEAQIDHVCQLTGSADHVGIGTDFDGGFGLQGVPTGLDSVADLGLIGEALHNRGYDRNDIEAVLGGNWQRLLRRTLRGAD